MEIQSAKLIITLVDESTGELLTREATLGDFKEVKKRASTSRSKKPEDNDPVAKIILLEGKYQFNNAAIEMTGFEPEMKIDIKFEKKGRIMYPVMCEDLKSGNRLTKTYTVSCKGSKRENLEEYGTIFELEPYEGKEGYFKMKGNVEKEDDIIDVPEEITNPDDEYLDNEESTIDNSEEINDIDFEALGF